MVKPETLQLEVIGAPVQSHGLALSLLKNLTSLNLSKNMLTIIPVDLLLLSQLQWLNIADNQLTTLYLELAFMPVLTELVRLNNQWRSPHDTVVQLPTDEMMQYMREVHLAHSTGELKMNGRHMKAVTADITLASALVSLDLDRNEIDVLSSDIANLRYRPSAPRVLLLSLFKACEVSRLPLLHCQLAAVL